MTKHEGKTNIHIYILNYKKKNPAIPICKQSWLFAFILTRSVVTILKQSISYCIYEISYLKVGKMSSKFLYSTAPSTNTVDSSSSEKSKEKKIFKLFPKPSSA